MIAKKEEVILRNNLLMQLMDSWESAVYEQDQALTPKIDIATEIKVLQTRMVYLLELFSKLF